MAWLLDTCAWIQHLKNPGGPIERRLRQLPPSEVLLCAVVKAELWDGAQKYGRRERRLVALHKMFHPFVSVPLDDAAARHYARIRHDLETRGQVIGPNDLKIAAICLAHGLTLVSSNTEEFSRVAGLRVEDWSRG